METDEQQLHSAYVINYNFLIRNLTQVILFK